MQFLVGDTVTLGLCLTLQCNYVFEANFNHFYIGRYLGNTLLSMRKSNFSICSTYLFCTVQGMHDKEKWVLLRSMYISKYKYHILVTSRCNESSALGGRTFVNTIIRVKKIHENAYDALSFTVLYYVTRRFAGNKFFLNFPFYISAYLLFTFSNKLRFFSHSTIV